MQIPRRVSALLLILAFKAAHTEAAPGATAGDPSLSKARHGLQAARLKAARHRQLAKAAAQQAEAAALRQAALVQKEVIEAAKLRAFEAATAAHAQKLARLDTARRDAKAERAADAAALVPLLPLMTRLALHPAATLLAAQSGSAGLKPGDAVKGALIMQGLTRAITARARALRRSERRLAALGAKEAVAQATMTDSVARQQAHEQALDADIDAVQRLEAAADQSAAAERAAAARAGETAKTLSGVIARLQAAAWHRAMLLRDEARKARAAKLAARKLHAEHAAARITLPNTAALSGKAGSGKAGSGKAGANPVAGRLVRRFGATTLAGPATGDTFAAAPGAVVITPAAGRVVFARPFRKYGKLLIVDCGDGYDFVFAGLEAFSVKVGAKLAAGQPVGRMPGYQPAQPGQQPELYVELRHDGAAVDPGIGFGHGLPGG
jgi:septal ring factor EnvC (AmiA/AmiB activator)